VGLADSFHNTWAGLGGRLSDHDRVDLPDKPPGRVVSLVPSMTASMFDLGLGERLIGVTDYCPQPQLEKSRLPTIGGTRDPLIEKIIALQPDLILANREENDRGAIEQLIERGLNVWVTFPCTVDEAIEDLWALIGLMPTEPHNTAILLTLERSLEWTRRSVQDQPRKRVFYPIWLGGEEDDPWFMTINAETYIHGVLEVCGGANVFAMRERRYPLSADLGRCEPEAAGERDCRYPRVTVDEVLTHAPEVILLPDEPFAFNEQHMKAMVEIFDDTPAVEAGNVHLIDGRLVNWHGTMLAQALVELPSFFASF
jgi:ABC-type Fe3+-hydroxamate transport system substrate-binding protein